MHLHIKIELAVFTLPRESLPQTHQAAQPASEDGGQGFVVVALIPPVPGPGEMKKMSLFFQKQEAQCHSSWEKLEAMFSRLPPATCFRSSAWRGLSGVGHAFSTVFKNCGDLKYKNGQIYIPIFPPARSCEVSAPK